MRNSKFKLLLCLCAFLSSWLLCGVEAKCEVLEFPGAEKHRFTAPEKQWLNFSFNVRDAACVTAKPFEIWIEREDQPLCILEIANGKCRILDGNICQCSNRSLLFTFSKIMEDDDNKKQWKWFVLHGLDVTDKCEVSFGSNSSQKPNDNSNCKNRLPSTHNMDTLTSSAEIPCMKIESTSSGQNNDNRKEQDSPIVMRSSSENVTAVLGETRRVDFLVQTRASQITNCTLSKTPNGSFAGRISTASPVNHSCIVRLDMQEGKNRSLQSTGSKCLCCFLTENASHKSLSVYVFDSRVGDSGRWSVTVKNGFGSGEAEFTLIVTDNTYAVREPEKWSSVPIVPILLAVVAGLVVVGMVSFMCWRRKTKAEFQEPDYRSTPMVNNSLVIRKLPNTPSMSSVTSLSNQTQSKRLLSVSRDQTRNHQTEEQVQETNAPTNVACEVNCCNEPVILDTGVKMSCSAVDMKLVLYIKGCPVNPETPPVASPTSADPEYLNPCSPSYVTMDTVEKRNLHGTYQNDMAVGKYVSMCPPRYCSMPKPMLENARVGGVVSSDPQIWNCNYDIHEGNGDTTILHLDCMNAFEKKVAEVSEYEKKCAEVSEYSVIG